MLVQAEVHKPVVKEKEHHVHGKKYRSRFEIASTILHVAEDGDATKTKLMYGSFLSFAQINEYLGFLLANELLAKEPETRIYTLTEKGMHFLHIYEELSKLIPMEERVPTALEVAG
jgi:predicted transcriptional regulator